jgi:hypothetical protein
VTVETAIPVEAPSREKTTADVLRHAARYLEEFGWVQDDVLDEHGRACAVGALYEVSDHDEYVLDAACRRLAPVVGIGSGTWVMQRVSIGRWNDTPGRTAAEVIAALRAAADAAEARS